MIRLHRSPLNTQSNIRRLCHDAVERFKQIDILTQAASLSFYALLSLAPLLILSLWLMTWINPAAENPLVSQVDQYVGDAAASVASTVIHNASQQPSFGTIAGMWSTLLLFIGATAVFAQLQTVFNLIFHNPTQHATGVLSVLKKRIFSLGMLITVGVLLLVSMVAMTALQFAFADVPSLLPMAGYLTSFAVYTLTFTLLFRYLPDRLVSWRHAVWGAIITAVLFAIGRYGIGIYIVKATPGSAYGSMGALVILLIWMYYASIILFIGAIITALIAERTPLSDHNSVSNKV